MPVEKDKSPPDERQSRKASPQEFHANKSRNQTVFTRQLFESIYSHWKWCHSIGKHPQVLAIHHPFSRNIAINDQIRLSNLMVRKPMVLYSRNPWIKGPNRPETPSATSSLQNTLYSISSAYCIISLAHKAWQHVTALNSSAEKGAFHKANTTAAMSCEACWVSFSHLYHCSTTSNKTDLSIPLLYIYNQSSPLPRIREGDPTYVWVPK